MIVKRLKYAVLCLFLLCFGAAFVVHPERYVTLCLEGFTMWAKCVLPSLFPFMVICLIFIKTGLADKASLPLKRAARALNLPQSAAVCFLLSVFSGYPAGSRVIAEFYDAGALDGNDCKKLAPLCSTSGPLFIIGSVGFGMFGDKTLGIKIFAAHALAVAAVSLILSKFGKKSINLPPKPTKSNGNALYDSFYGAVVSVAVAGGYIAFFYVVAAFLHDFGVLAPLENFFKLFMDEKAACALCAGLAEVTTGCRAMSQSGVPYGGALAGFMITFGGLSILLQQLGYLTKTGVRPASFIAVKLVQATVCAAVLFVL